MLPRATPTHASAITGPSPHQVPCCLRAHRQAALSTGVLPFVRLSPRYCRTPPVLPAPYSLPHSAASNRAMVAPTAVHAAHPSHVDPRHLTSVPSPQALSWSAPLPHSFFGLAVPHRVVATTAAMPTTTARTVGC